MNPRIRVFVFSSLALGFLCPSAAEPTIPKPFVIAPECTEAQRSSAVAVARPKESVIACYFLEKWSFKGAALAVEPNGYAGIPVSESDFYQLRKKVYREQSARLRTERDMKEAMPGEPPPHAGVPPSLFVRTRTPLGVFLNESKHIGFADLVPTAPHNDQVVTQVQYPLIQLETFVHTNGRVIKLIQVAPISGPSTVGEGFRMADDWARRLNGGERLATED
jgi:hypothetical protein